jgi:hypothetical protein
MSDENVPKPTIETILERLQEFRSEVTSQFEDFRTEVNTRLDKVDIRLDRIHSELFTLRADFNEFKGERDLTQPGPPGERGPIRR